MSSGVFAEASAIPREDQGPVLGPGWWNDLVTTAFLAGIVLSGVLLLDKSPSNLATRRQMAIAIFAICSVPSALTMIQLARLRSKIGSAPRPRAARGAQQIPLPNDP